MKWLISIPVWGQPYHDVFRTKTVPALRAALEDFKHDVRFVIHTDKSVAIEELLCGFNVEAIRIQPKPTYVTLQNSHADSIMRAEVGERVALLNADIVVSRNLFQSCEEHIQNGKHAVVLCGIRTIKGEDIPIGAEPRRLLRWAWEYRHQIIRDLEWGSGGSLLPTNLFFNDVEKGTVVMHGFHLHPVAILKTGEIRFRSTIDGDLLESFPRELIHVVTDPRDMSMAEISDSHRRFPVRGVMDERSVAISMTKRASDLHRWLFTHRITVVGHGDTDMDEHVVSTILRRLGPTDRERKERARR